MIETLIVVLVILWLVGFTVAPVLGSAVHVLLVVALVLVIVRLLKSGGRGGPL